MRAHRSPSPAEAQPGRDPATTFLTPDGEGDGEGSRVLLVLLIAMLALVAVLSATVPIDRVVVARGRVTSEAPTITVQPLDTGVIRSIDVREGQIVARGAILARLDPTFSGADVTQLERQIATQEAEIGRLEAELAGQRLEPASDAPHHQLQAAIWRYRQAELRAQLLRFDERIEATRAQIRRGDQDVAHGRQRVAVLGQIETMRSSLERRQSGSRLEVLVASDRRLEVALDLAASEEGLRSATHQLRALEAERDAFGQQWLAKAASDLAERRVSLDRLREERAKAQKRFELVELRAIQDAVVLQVAPLSVGSVARSAEALVTLVPLDAKLEVEAEIDGNDQGSVRPGDPVEIKLDAYPYLRHGTVKGMIRTISADAFTPSAAGGAPAGRAFYRARIDVTGQDLRLMPRDFRLVPGMPLTVDVVIGARTIASYFLEGALRPLAEGMREP